MIALTRQFPASLLHSSARAAAQLEERVKYLPPSPTGLRGYGTSLGADQGLVLIGALGHGTQGPSSGTAFLLDATGGGQQSLQANNG